MSDVLDKEDEGKRILFISPKNPRGALICTSMLKNIRDTYKNHNIYVACEPPNNCFFEGNEYVHKIIPYSNEMQAPQWLKGIIHQTEFFNVIFSSNSFDSENFSVFSKKETTIPYSNFRYAHS
jgi:ADP-heptose:LPS heptosyltransferase